MAPRNYLNLRLAEGVRRLGFRKWYERELLSSHAHLVLTLLSTIALIGLMELMASGTARQRLLHALLFVVSAAIALWSLRRYLYLLMHAEEIANQAVCERCSTYGRFAVLSEDPRTGQAMIRCHHCKHTWHIKT